MNKGLEYAEQAKTILRNAEVDGRELTPEEKGAVETLLGKARLARDEQAVWNKLDGYDRTPTDPNAAPWARGISSGPWATGGRISTTHGSVTHDR